MSVTYFINKLFNISETTELNEMDVILQNIKAALVYKGLEFSIVFAENTVEDVKKRRGAPVDKSNVDDTMKLEKKAKETPIDLTQHYTRFS